MKKLVSLLLVTLMSVSLLWGCAAEQPPEPANEPVMADEPAAEPDATEPEPADTTEAAEVGGDITIGVSVGDLRLERWQRDLDYMVTKAESLGAEVFSASADGDATTQVSQIENMITQGCEAIIIIPLDSNVLGPVVDQCNEAGVKVIAYDRIINNCNLDYYITFNFEVLGHMIAQSLLDVCPTGNYYMQMGPQEDTNQQLFYKYFMEVLQPEVDAGNINIVGTQYAADYSGEVAMTQTEQVLTANNNEIDAILAQCDALSVGVISALEAQGLAGQIPVTGHDADLASCQLIAEGKQYMTIYKRLEDLAAGAIELAYQAVTDTVPELTDTYNNGLIDVPAVNLPGLSATKENLVETVVKDGFHSYADVYANVPEDERPANPNNYP